MPSARLLPGQVLVQLWKWLVHGEPFPKVAELQQPLSSLGDAGGRWDSARDVSGEGGSSQLQSFPPAWELRLSHCDPLPKQGQCWGPTGQL